MRLFAENKNAIESRSHLNFGVKDDEITARYNKAINTLEGLKKNSNTLIDAVLVFPLEQWEEAKMTDQQVNKALQEIVRDIQAETGLTPIGWKMHLDEGRLDEDGKLILNPHAHLLFANVCTTDFTLKKECKRTVKDENGKAVKDPKKPNKWLYERDANGDIVTDEISMPMRGKMPLQYMQSRGSGSVWSRIQDIAANRLTPYGFERGVSKELTKKAHLEKTQHVEADIKRKAQEVENLELEIIERTEKINQIIEKERNIFKDFALKLISWHAKALNPEIPLSKKIEATREVHDDFISELNCESKVELIDHINNTYDSVSEAFTGDIEGEAKELMENINKEAQKSKDGLNKRSSKFKF